MELLAPAGNIEKLRYAYLYGADAAYIGLHGFSLRSRADNFGPDELAELRRIKAGRRLYCALNIYFFDQDISALEAALERIDDTLFDAFIVSDPGILPLLRRRFPSTELHLSTQANCVNSEAARFYRDLGFRRIIPGRELSLAEIAAIRKAVPDVELEVFAHGAMCLAYSGRCFLSRWMSDRSANQGDCAHSCRWSYRVGTDPLVLEEQQRPGEFYPISEGDGFTEILSSRDLCMIDHLGRLRDAGVDSLKIEGRMKSIYYTALVTRAYRAALDALQPATVAEHHSTAARTAFTAELDEVSHRDYTTGFYFDRDQIERPASRGYRRGCLFLGTVEERVGARRFRIAVKNAFAGGQLIEFVGPRSAAQSDDTFALFDDNGNPVDRVIHHGNWYLETDCSVEEGYLIRTRPANAAPVPGRPL
ncbi:MAG: U32 family peptidase [Spirochaetaceae bacterium]|nr:MAG: U32 family peptidase [Spirochaetaceae bacterium]